MKAACSSKVFLSVLIIQHEWLFSYPCRVFSQKHHCENLKKAGFCGVSFFF
jgi:hypothetical protein